MSDNDTSALCNGSGPYPHWPSPSMTHPSPEAVAKAMDYAVVVARDMKRRAARGTHPDMPSETCIDTLAAHVTALTTQLEAERAKWADAALQHANNILAKLDTIADLHARLSAETARADKAEAEAKALREAAEPFVRAADAAERNCFPLDGAVFRSALDYDMRALGRDNSEDVYRDSVRTSDLYRLRSIVTRATLAQPAADGGKT